MWTVFWLAGCSGGNGTSLPHATSTLDGSSTALPLGEPGLIQVISLDSEQTTLFVDLTRRVDLLCSVTSKDTDCVAPSGGPVCFELEWLHPPNPYHLEAWDGDALMDCVEVGEPSSAHPDCRPVEPDIGTPPACMEWFAPSIDLACGPSSTYLAIVDYEGSSYDVRVTAADELGVHVDVELTVHSGYESLSGCTELPNCPPEGLLWTVDVLQDERCTVAGPDLDGSLPCTHTRVDQLVVSEDRECPHYGR